MMIPDFSRGRRAIFIGSSVCVGEGATQLHGWSHMVAQRLWANGWQTHNCAIGGQNTADILQRLERDVIAHAPTVCFVGLGLSNEGLTTAIDPRIPCGIFLSNLRKIVDTLWTAGIFPVIGGVYPNDEMDVRQYACMREVYAQMDGWDEIVLQWLQGLSDGTGHYKQGYAHDPWHPNDAGYARFFEQIPQTLWEVLDAPALPCSKSREKVAFSPSTYADFPADTTVTCGMHDLPMEKDAMGLRLHTDILYSRKNETDLYLQIVVPDVFEKPGKYPLVVYVQGSAWRKQDTTYNLMNLGKIAQRGYVVAVVEYRASCVAPFPAQIEDTKCAIRFLREQADAYCIDPQRVCLFGDSSGGHTAMIAGMSADGWPNATQLGDATCAVCGIVDFYGPTDISKMNNSHSTMNHMSADSPEGMLIGGRTVPENPSAVAPTVVMPYALGADIPPLLMVHGNKDRLVPFTQSVILYEAMRDAGKDVQFYRLRDADHGGPAFWSRTILDLVCDFFARCMPET